MDKVAVVGAGLIGRAWAMVFARAGLSVSLWDKVDGVAEGAMALIAGSLADLRAAGLVKEAPEVILARITPAATLAECVAGAIHVQENGPERLAPKQELFAELDRLCPPEVVLASSTRGIPASEFTGNLPGRGRCLVAHPVNPPYLVPLVELVGRALDRPGGGRPHPRADGPGRPGAGGGLQGDHAASCSTGCRRRWWRRPSAWCGTA